MAPHHAGVWIDRPLGGGKHAATPTPIRRSDICDPVRKADKPPPIPSAISCRCNTHTFTRCSRKGSTTDCGSILTPPLPSRTRICIWPKSTSFLCSRTLFHQPQLAAVQKPQHQAGRTHYPRQHCLHFGHYQHTGQRLPWRTDARSVSHGSSILSTCR